MFRVSCDVMRQRMVKSYRRFGRRNCLRFQSYLYKFEWEIITDVSAALPASWGFISLRTFVLLHPDGGGSTPLRNVGIYFAVDTVYYPKHPKRFLPSLIPLWEAQSRISRFMLGDTKIYWCRPMFHAARAVTVKSNIWHDREPHPEWMTGGCGFI
jgi:hypothetical protein